MAEMKNPNVHAKKNRNDTPRKRKTHIIKVRVTAEEKLRIAYACKELHLTQSELVRRVLYGVNVKHTVVVAQGGEDALAALATLSAHYRCLQRWRVRYAPQSPTEELHPCFLEAIKNLDIVEYYLDCSVLPDPQTENELRKYWEGLHERLEKEERRLA